jgi:hypothetical protein
MMARVSVTGALWVLAATSASGVVAFLAIVLVRRHDSRVSHVGKERKTIAFAQEPAAVKYAPSPE